MTVEQVPAASGSLFPVAVTTDRNDVFFWMSGATAIPLYHHHPHVPEECVLPDDIREQTRRVMTTFDEVLRFNGLGWRNVVRFTQFLTDLRDHDVVQEVVAEYLADSGWAPSNVTVGINQLSAPGARLEIDVVAALTID